MKLRTTLFCFLVLSTFFSYGQNKRNSAGQRHGKWVYLGKDYSNGKYPKNIKVEEGYYVNGRKEGEWTKFYNDGKIKFKGTYRNNRPEGSYTRYYSNGKIAEQGEFQSNGYRGQLLRYYQNGNLAYRATFNNQGQESGKVIYYHKNGKEALSYTVKNGTVQGQVSRFDANGNLLTSFLISQNGSVGPIQKVSPQVQNNASKLYTTSNSSVFPPKLSNPKTKGLRFVPNGYNKVYNSNDEIWMDGDFRNGQLYDGKVYDYDKDGILQKVRIFKSGKYHSDGQL